MRAPGSLYSKGIGLVASSLPLAGPDEGSISKIFEVMSVWAEQPIFSYQLLGEKGGAISPAQGGVGTRDQGRMGSNCRLALGFLGSQELACGWARHLPHWQGFRVRTEQGMGCV